MHALCNSHFIPLLANIQKIADEQKRTADKKGVEMQEKFDVRAADTKYLREATEQLIEVQEDQVLNMHIRTNTRGEDKTQQKHTSSTSVVFCFLFFVFFSSC